jgi:hypothetical protein
MNPIAEIFNVLKFLFSVDTKNIESTMYDYLKSEYLTFSWILIILNILFLGFYYYLLYQQTITKFIYYFFFVIITFILNLIITYFLFDIIIEPRWQSGYPELPNFLGLIINMAVPFSIILFFIQLIISVFFQLGIKGAIRPFPKLNTIFHKA